MSAEIIRLSDRRKVHSQPLAEVVKLSFGLFAVYLLLGAVIYGALFAAARR